MMDQSGRGMQARYSQQTMGEQLVNFLHAFSKSPIARPRRCDIDNSEY
jgi:hypothetical protein